MATKDLYDRFTDPARLPSGRVWLQIMRAQDDATDETERQAERQAERNGLHVTRRP